MARAADRTKIEGTDRRGERASDWRRDREKQAAATLCSRTPSILFHSPHTHPHLLIYSAAAAVQRPHSREPIDDIEGERAEQVERRGCTRIVKATHTLD